MPPKYPPVPLGEPPSYPPAPWKLGNNTKVEELAKIKIDDVDALKEALKKAGVGPGSKKKVYLVKEEDGETHVQISLPVKDLFDEEFEDRSSEALDISQIGGRIATTPLTTTTTSTTETASTSTKQSAQLKFEMNDFWLQMQKLFKPGQILMAGKNGVKLNNILISKEQEESEEVDPEYYYEDEEIEEFEDERSGKLDMTLTKVTNLDLRDIIRSQADISTGNIPIPAQEEVKVFLVDLPKKQKSTPKSIFRNNFDALPTERIFVPDEQTPVESARPKTENLLIVTPQPQTTTFTAYPKTPETTTDKSKEMLELLRSTLGGLVNSVEGLNNTVREAMNEKSKEIRKEKDSEQIKSLQVEIASLTKMVHDLRVQKQNQQNQNFMSLIAETQNMLKMQEQREKERESLLKEQEEKAREKEMMLKKLTEREKQREAMLKELERREKERELEKKREEILQEQREKQRELEKQREEMLKELEQLEKEKVTFVTPSPIVPQTTSTQRTTRQIPTTVPKTSTTPYNWFTSTPVSTTTAPQFQTFQSISVQESQNIDSGLVSNINQVIHFGKNM